MVGLGIVRFGLVMVSLIFVGFGSGWVWFSLVLILVGFVRIWLFGSSWIRFCLNLVLVGLGYGWVGYRYIWFCWLGWVLLDFWFCLD
jgi:hypothetical protein